MKPFEAKEYKVFDLFNSKWALATAGTPQDYNTCVVGWGMLGNIWDLPGKRSVVSIFVHPDRYTSQFLKKYDMFTVSFYSLKYKPALTYLGSHSGRDGDKVAKVGLTPLPIGDGVTFEEAEITFLCHKLYLHQFSKDGLSEEIKKYYAGRPKVYPNVSPDGTSDNWEPHYAIVGEITEVRDTTEDGGRKRLFRKK